MRGPDRLMDQITEITGELAMFDAARKSRNRSSGKNAERSAKIITPSFPITLFNDGKYRIGRNVMDLHVHLLMWHNDDLREQGLRIQRSFVSGHVFGLRAEPGSKYARLDLPFLEINIDKLPALQTLTQDGYTILDPYFRRMDIH